MHPIRFLSLFLFTACAGLMASERPVVKSTEAAALSGKMATVYGQVIEVRRVAKGPVIFEIDGAPAAPAFRALVYPMAVERFGSAPENIYLGQTVEVTGLVLLRDELAQMWISDPSHIRLHKTPSENAAETPEAK